MKQTSLPTTSKHGVVVKPLRGAVGPARATPRPRLPSGRTLSAPGDDRVARARIFRDIVVLVVLAVTIIAGSAVLIGTLWREVALAETEARIVEAEQAARTRMAEIDLLAESQAIAAAGYDMSVLILGGLVVLLVVVCLLKPTIVLGRFR